MDRFIGPPGGLCGRPTPALPGASFGMSLTGWCRSPPSSPQFPPTSPPLPWDVLEALPVHPGRSAITTGENSPHLVAQRMKPPLGFLLAFAWCMVWNFRTLSDPVRPLSVAMPCSLSMLLPTQGPFPPPALPRLYYRPLRHPVGPDSHRRGPVGVASPPTGELASFRFPCGQATPAGGARVARFPLRLRLCAGGTPALRGGPSSHAIRPRDGFRKKKAPFHGAPGVAAVDFGLPTKRILQDFQ